MIKKLKFLPEQIDDILSGQKYTTWRVDSENLAYGDTFSLVNSATNEIAATAEVNELSIKQIKNITETDMQGHEKFESTEQICDVLSARYQKKVNPETAIQIVKFKLLPKEDVKKSTYLTEAKLYADGGSRGNPGPSASGYVIFDMANTVVKKGGKYLGVTTNNQAEYQAVLLGIKAAKELGVKKLHIYLDSLLVVNQMTGIFKIKNRDLWPINQAIHEEKNNFSQVSFTHVPRELNKDADSVVNEILDTEANN
jgi:ribonuclease HI